jgi:hypothetical protein
MPAPPTVIHLGSVVVQVTVTGTVAAQPALALSLAGSLSPETSYQDEMSLRLGGLIIINVGSRPFTTRKLHRSKMLCSRKS